MSEDAYARKEGFPTKFVMIVLAAVVITLWFAFGQGFVASFKPRISEPPSIWLVYNDELYPGIRGSYCWFDRCVDTWLLEPQDGINISKGSTITFTDNTSLQPDDMDVRAYVIGEQGMQLEASGIERAGIDTYRVNLENGIYLVNVFTTWQDLGDVNYTFKIIVS